MSLQPSPGGLSRRSFISAAAAVSALGVAGLSGCAAPKPEGGSSAAGITFTSWSFNNTAIADPLRQILSTYSSKNSVAISENTYPYLQYLDQIVLKAKGRNITGVAHIDEEWMSTLVALGVLGEARGFDESRYAPQILQSGVQGGTRYAMPWTQSAIGMIVNTELLDKAGVKSRPTSIQEFTQMLRALKKVDSNLIPYAPATDVKQVKDMIPWMWSFGAKIVENGQVTLGDAPSVAAINYWKSLLDEGLIQAGVVRDDARTLFAQKRAAIYDDAPQAISIIPAQSPDKSIAKKMSPLQRPVDDPGIKPASLVWSQPLVAFGDAEPYWNLAEFMSTDETSLKTMFEVGGQPPTTNAALAADWFTSNAFQAEWNTVVSAGGVRNPFWSFPSATAAQTVFNEHVEQALRGSVSAEKAMAGAKSELQELLK